jgi:undecaprenyl diphosphate synthase
MGKVTATPIDPLSESELLSLLDLDQLPRHVAIIMDGNGRWAELRGLPRIAGHSEGIKSVREIIKLFIELGINALTI